MIIYLCVFVCAGAWNLKRCRRLLAQLDYRNPTASWIKKIGKVTFTFWYHNISTPMNISTIERLTATYLVVFESVKNIHATIVQYKERVCSLFVSVLRLAGCIIFYHILSYIASGRKDSFCFLCIFTLWLKSRFMASYISHKVWVFHVTTITVYMNYLF